MQSLNEIVKANKRATKAAPLPKVQAAKSTKGEVVFYFDPAKVPSRNASLSTRLKFAAAFLRRMTEPGAVSPSRTFALCVKWVEEAANNG